MKICVKTQAKESGSRRMAVSLQERLPSHVSAPCQLTCDFQIEPHGHYYLLTLNVSGELDIICQRCLHVFQHSYTNTSQLAICSNDARAESLMEQFECIVAHDGELDLIEILTDELYLYTPEKHPHFSDCDSEVSRLIRDEDIPFDESII